MRTDKLKRSVEKIPDSPGVYFMKNTKGRVLYVGKAKRLISRVRSYLQKEDALDPKTRALMNSTDAIDYIATENEVEALVLECNLIKEYRPRYNVQLKDDKRYPFIKLTRNEMFPRLLLVRHVENDGAEYFGPYTDVRAVRRTLKLVGTIFPLRGCIGKKFSKRERECLNFDIKRCLGPCTGRIGEDEYRRIVDEARLFLKGRKEELRTSLLEKMQALSQEKRYEEAALARDQVRALEALAQKQLAVSPRGEDEDIIAFAREGGKSCGVVMKIREGRILASEAFIIPAVEKMEDDIIFDSFITLYYHSATDIPPRIFTQIEPSEAPLIEDWLSGAIGRRVRIATPKRGEKKKLVALAYKNASYKIVAEVRAKAESTTLLRDMKDALHLPTTPLRIEAFDISNIQGAEAVGSMVTFVKGKPLKSGYRHFKIKTVEGIDDCAMLEEVLSRRLKTLKAGKEQAPDFILIDGGKGQVSATRSAMEISEVTGIPIVGLAKKNEEIHIEETGDPLRLSRRNKVLRYLQRIRNEAHRFAVEYHRRLRSRGLAVSELDAIPGIGEKRKMLLLVEFGSLERLRKASIEEIAAIHGIGETIAGEIFRHLHDR